MKVGELRKILSHFDQNAEVVISVPSMDTVQRTYWRYGGASINWIKPENDMTFGHFSEADPSEDNLRKTLVLHEMRCF